MAFLRTTLLTEAKQVAQDSTAGVPLLKNVADYEEAIDQALRHLSADRPNLRVIHQVLAATGFRQVLFGAGAFAGLTGLDAWTDGYSAVRDVYYPYVATSQDNEPIDQNEWYVDIDPGKTVLHFRAVTPVAGQTLRLVFENPHTLHTSDLSACSVKDGDKDPLVILTAAYICLLAAVRYVQNTGSTNLPNDVVDRRSQSDIMKARYKDLIDSYNMKVGKGKGEDIKGASAFGDLDVLGSSPFGLMWHPTRSR